MTPWEQSAPQCLQRKALLLDHLSGRAPRTQKAKQKLHRILRVLEPSSILPQRTHQQVPPRNWGGQWSMGSNHQEDELSFQERAHRYYETHPVSKRCCKHLAAVASDQQWVVKWESNSKIHSNYDQQEVWSAENDNNTAWGLPRQQQTHPHQSPNWNNLNWGTFHLNSYCISRAYTEDFVMQSGEQLDLWISRWKNHR